MKKIVFVFLFMMTIHFVSAQVIISQGSSWKYLDNGSNQGNSWKEVAFNDESWSKGNAQLGYGDGDEKTVIAYGSSSSNKHICYYFRKTFSVTDPNVNPALKISLLRDDVAVVYINGNEVVRSNMPSGNILFNTVASSTIAGSSEDIFNEYNISSSVLNMGENVIAVEVHQRSKSSSDISFDLKMEFSELDYYKKSPCVLYPAKNDEMIIIWQLNSTENCTFEYGTDTGYSEGTINTSEFNSDHQHKVYLKDLSIDKKYYYRISINNSSIKEGSFNTGIEDDAETLTFFAYGDTRTNADKHDEVANRIILDINQNDLKQTFVMNTGDLVSNGDSEGSWQSEFFNKQYTHISDLLANLPYMAAMGNHEGQGILFAKYFPYPMFQNNRYYYSFDYGPLHVTVIDEETYFSPGSTQYNWIKNDLSSSDKKWKIVMMHKPGWSAGAHSNSSSVQNYLQPLFEKYGVSFVLSGHNHYYSRAKVDNVVHITTGGGGAPLYNPNSNYPNIEKVDKSYHYCKFEINKNALHFSAIRSNGTLIEEFDTFLTSTGNVERSNSWIKIYPNPTNSNFVVEGEEINKIEILDINGKMNKQIKTSGEKFLKIDLSDIEKGLYFIHINTAKGAVIKKFIVN